MAMTVAGSHFPTVPTERSLGMTSLPRRWLESIVPKWEAEVAEAEAVEIL